MIWKHVQLLTLGDGKIFALKVEWMARLDFLWQLQSRDEKLDMEALQGCNR